MQPLFLLFPLGLLGIVVTWLCGMRPYVRRHGKGYRTGGNLYVAAWVDWQSCGEIAVTERERTGRYLRNAFVLSHIAMVVGILSTPFPR